MTGPGIPTTLAELAVPVDGLVPYRDNPRRGNVELIAESLERNGQYRPIVVRARTNEVLAGNHTLKAAKHLGWTQVAATFVDCTDDQAARIVLVDNRANDLADYDNAELLKVLESLDDGDLGGTGFNDHDLADLAEGLEDEQPEETPEGIDDVPDAPVRTITRAGDVWELGEHRVICGDSTEPGTYEALLAGERADAIWTDPPYGVEYVGKTKDALRIQNDGGGSLEALLTDAFAALVPAARPGAPIYIAHSDTRRITFEQTATAAGILVRQNLIWVKNTMVLGHSDYQYQHEPILYGTTPEEAEAEGLEHAADDAGYSNQHEPILYGFTPGGKGRLGRGGPYWRGPNNATTIFQVPKPPRSKDHPTMKPVDLVRQMLSNSVRRNGIVLDPFGGSGSTLLAAHLEGARARLIELDPRFVDVICRRYQEHTGQLPVRAGEQVDFEQEERI